jgi:hypothetical protein
MLLNKIIWGCLGVWALLFGLFGLTNIQIEWGQPLMYFAALILGIFCIIQVVVNWRK